MSANPHQEAEQHEQYEDGPNLGLATTRQLLDELAARIEVDGANGGGGP